MIPYISGSKRKRNTSIPPPRGIIEIIYYLTHSPYVSADSRTYTYLDRYDNHNASLLSNVFKEYDILHKYYLNTIIPLLGTISYIIPDHNRIYDLFLDITYLPYITNWLYFEDKSLIMTIDTFLPPKPNSDYSDEINIDRWKFHHSDIIIKHLSTIHNSINEFIEYDHLSNNKEEKLKQFEEVTLVRERSKSNTFIMLCFKNSDWRKKFNLNSLLFRNLFKLIMVYVKIWEVRKLIASWKLGTSNVQEKNRIRFAHGDEMRINRIIDDCLHMRICENNK